MVMPKQHPHLDNKEGFLRWFLASDQGGNFGYQLLVPYHLQKAGAKEPAQSQN